VNYLFQIDALKRALDLGAKLKPSDFYQKGQLVEITDGPFKGSIGKIFSVKNMKKFVITLDAIQTAYAIESIEINPEIIQPLKPLQVEKAAFSVPLGVKNEPDILQHPDT